MNTQKIREAVDELRTWGLSQQYIDGVLSNIIAELDKAEQPGEPVAWTTKTALDISERLTGSPFGSITAASRNLWGETGIPLYTHPPKAKQPAAGLTDEEVERLGSEREAHLIDLGADPQAANNDRIAFETGLIESRHYLAPAAGLTVDEAMKSVKDAGSQMPYGHINYDIIRAHLTAAIKAKNNA